MEQQIEHLADQLRNAVNGWMKTPAAYDKGLIHDGLKEIFLAATPESCAKAFIAYHSSLSRSSKEHDFLFNNHIHVIFNREIISSALLRETRDLHEQALMAELNENPSALGLWQAASTSAMSTTKAYSEALSQNNENYILDLMKTIGERTKLAFRR